MRVILLSVLLSFSLAADPVTPEPTTTAENPPPVSLPTPQPEPDGDPTKKDSEFCIKYPEMCQ